MLSCGDLSRKVTFHKARKYFSLFSFTHTKTWVESAHDLLYFSDLSPKEVVSRCVFLIEHITRMYSTSVVQHTSVFQDFLPHLSILVRMTCVFLRIHLFL